MPITTLIDKKDNFEIIRDQIAAILVLESTSQQALAVLAAKDPKEWKLRVFTERSNPWELFQDANAEQTPIINVWYGSSNFDKKSSNAMERQHSASVYNIDIYALGVSRDIPGGGHTPGDEDAAFRVQAAIKLVRNMLMASIYTYLDLRGLVWGRWPQSVNVFQPQVEGKELQQVIGARIVMAVDFNEFSPQFEPETLEFVAIDVKRTEDGEIILEADYDYTAP